MPNFVQMKDLRKEKDNSNMHKNPSERKKTLLFD